MMTQSKLVWNGTLWLKVHSNMAVFYRYHIDKGGLFEVVDGS